MTLKLKGSKVKKEAKGSDKSKDVKLKDIKDLKDAKPVAAVVVSMAGATGKSLQGVKFKLTTPDGPVQGQIDGSGKISASMSKEGDSKLEFTSLTDDLKKAR